MGKSKSKSKNRSISKWKVFSPFRRAERTRDNEPVEETHTQKTSPAPAPEIRTKSAPKCPRGTAETARAPTPPPSKTDEIKRSSEDPGTLRKVEKKEEKVEKKEEKVEKKEEKEEKVKTEESPTKPTMPAAASKKKKSEKEEGSVFEEVAGPAAPAQSGAHGIKNKMRWKVDVDPVDLNGDPKMSEVLEKFKTIKKKYKQKKSKQMKEIEKEKTWEADESAEEQIVTSARVLQLIKMEALISKELSEPEQETLRGYCRSGDHEEKAEGLIEKIAASVLNAVVSKNEFVRNVNVSGQLRMFSVDDRKAKIPLMALLMARKDLLYVSWSKPNRDVEIQLDATWNCMATRQVPQAAVISTRLA
ncbi:unnamed protein product [Caenorhabditis sp. 36 PRJEB53466]|nr:unnamed protein product [Caenorhabditis sp. 36 PRJEB53466]